MMMSIAKFVGAVVVIVAALAWVIDYAVDAFREAATQTLTAALDMQGRPFVLREQLRQAAGYARAQPDQTLVRDDVRAIVLMLLPVVRELRPLVKALEDDEASDTK